MPDQEVFRLEIPMDHVLRVAIAQGIRHLLHVHRRATFTVTRREKSIYKLGESRKLMTETVRKIQGTFVKEEEKKDVL